MDTPTPAQITATRERLADMLRLSGHLFIIERATISRRGQKLIDVVQPLGRTVAHIGLDVAIAIDLPYDMTKRGLYVKDIGPIVARLSDALYHRPDMLTWQAL